jgi:hypothetical protein
MAEIYLWNPKDGNVGHCSLRLDDESYISFWPCEEYGGTKAFANRTVPSTSGTYESDKVSEGGRGPDKTIRIRGTLNNQKIHTWWRKNQACGYSVTNNSSTMVEIALEVGDLNSHE